MIACMRSAGVLSARHECSELGWTTHRQELVQHRVGRAICIIYQYATRNPEAPTHLEYLPLLIPVQRLILDARDLLIRELLHILLGEQLPSGVAHLLEPEFLVRKSFWFL